MRSVRDPFLAIAHFTVVCSVPAFRTQIDWEHTNSDRLDIRIDPDMDRQGQLVRALALRVEEPLAGLGCPRLDAWLRPPLRGRVSPAVCSPLLPRFSAARFPFPHAR